MPAYLKPVDKGPRIVITKAIVLVGRHPSCDVVIKGSRKISRKHCCIAQVNSSFFVRDLGSMNGVRLNGQRVRKEAELTNGDRVAIGEFEYTFRLVAGKDEKSNGSKPRKVKQDDDFPASEPEIEEDFGLEDLPSAEAGAYPLLDDDESESRRT